MSERLLPYSSITEEAPAVSSERYGHVITLNDDELCTVNNDLCITVLSGIAWITSGHVDIIRYPHETIKVHRSQHPTVISSAKTSETLRFRCQPV